MDGLPNEGAFLSDALPYPERFGWPRMWCRCQEKLRVPADDVQRAKRIRRQWSLWVRGDPDYIVEKTISNVLRIEFLVNTFRDAKFVYIIRNGYAVAAGIRHKANLRRWKNPNNIRCYPIELCAEQWVESVRIVKEAIVKGLPIIPVRYEDLTTNTVDVMNSVFRGIGVSEMSVFSEARKLEIHEAHAPICNMNAASFARLSQDDRCKIKEVAARELQDYGYTC
jgi:hypothetical protein